jgi:large subunit ribosomal protein L17
MRHQRAGLHLSRTSSHRRALFSNLIASLFTHERIRTTDAKAKETRRLAERTITLARRLGDVLTKEADSRTPEERARVVHAVRLARRLVRDRGAVVKLFDEIGPRYLGRPGGYTRIIKVGNRPGDAAPISILELIPDGQRPGSEKAAEPAAKGAPSGKKAAKEASGKPEKAAKAAKSKSSEDEGTRGAAKERAKQATSAKAKAKPAAKAKASPAAKPKPESGKTKKK